MSRPLDPTERQRLKESLLRVIDALDGLPCDGPRWDAAGFPDHAAGVLGEAARVLMAERWHMRLAAQETDDAHA